MFFDFSKAFDLVDHNILLNKINKYLPEWITQWIAQYLSNRSQRVKYENIVTDWRTVKAGVIQGSVLGPTLFILFLHEIGEQIPSIVNAPMYEVGILVYNTDKALVQQAADGVNKWTKENNMRLNIEKTKKMTINKQKTSSDFSISINNTELEQVDEYKYLGALVTSDLDWQKHWAHISRNFNSTIYLLKQMKQLGFRKKLMVNVYKSFILNQIISNSNILCSANKNIKNEIERIQNRAIKIINIQPNELPYFKIINTNELIDK